MAIAPAAPEAGLSVGLVLLAIACLFLLALNKVYKLTIGALVSTLASMFDSLSFKVPIIHATVGLGFIGDALKNVDNYVLEAIGTGIQQTENGLHACIGAMTWLLQETADQVAGLAGDTANAFNWVRHSLIPSQIFAATHWLRREVIHLADQIAHLAVHPVQAVHTTTRVIAPGLKALEGKVSSLEAQVEAIGARGFTKVYELAPAIALPKPTAIPGDIYRGIDSLWRESKRIGKVLTPAGIVGLVAASVFSLAHLSWLRCANVRNAARRLCGMNPDALESLLAGLFVVFGTLSLTTFAREVQDVTGDFAVAVRKFWRADVQGPGKNPGLGDTGL